MTAPQIPVERGSAAQSIKIDKVDAPAPALARACISGQNKDNGRFCAPLGPGGGLADLPLQKPQKQPARRGRPVGKIAMSKDRDNHWIGAMTLQHCSPNHPRHHLYR
jgi:hypothetical protein